MNYENRAVLAVPTPAEISVAEPGRVLTPAERQRRHRAKKKAETAAHSTTVAGTLLTENMRLARQVEILGRDLAEQKARAQKAAAEAQQLLEDVAADRGRLQRLRAAFGALLPRLTPATSIRIRHALTEAGFIEWLDTG
ncbi:hypothetical protein AB4Z46_02625 [Variovorax sp. M-6]|uniref:hypothetical protein n=1 Tax=Variovorax sp. M-6 TaxID=3233041 RepID=UPI003F9C0F09